MTKKMKPTTAAKAKPKAKTKTKAGNERDSQCLHCGQSFRLREFDLFRDVCRPCERFYPPSLLQAIFEDGLREERSYAAYIVKLRNGDIFRFPSAGFTLSEFVRLNQCQRLVNYGNDIGGIFDPPVERWDVRVSEIVWCFPEIWPRRAEPEEEPEPEENEEEEPSRAAKRNGSL